MRARGYAIRGESIDCFAALDQARRTLSNVGTEDPADWIAGFDDASLASETSLCMRHLGDLAEAQRQAEEVIRLRSGDRVRARTFAQLTLAEVLVDTGRINEAADLGRAVCEAAMSLTSARAHARLDQLGDALAPHQSESEVRRFQQELEMVRASTRPGVASESVWPV